jgi:hypothetical protein
MFMAASASQTALPQQRDYCVAAAASVLIGAIDAFSQRRLSHAYRPFIVPTSKGNSGSIPVDPNTDDLTFSAATRGG